ncbi:hypothetical protein BGX38DRAFT_1176694 [Terfezia claveryi]|nr:hypothetical protein BGX38DRAFT_1176694 [Terfezia claveryi]
MLLTLFCLVQGTQTAFAVDIDRNKTVSHLKGAIKAEEPNVLACVGAPDLRLWKVEIPDDRDDLIQGQTLQDDNQLLSTRRLARYWTDTPPSDHIHVIIKLPEPAPPSELESPTQRKRKRWAALNSILDKNKKVKTTADGAKSTGYSYVSWEDIRSVYEPVMYGMTIQPKEIPAEDLESLYKYLCRATPVFGPIYSGKEAKRLHFVAPILIYLGGLFNGRMRILIEERIPGKNIHTDGNFEFVVQIGGKKICIIQAKKDDMEQGMAQDLLGCEAVADTENSECVLGIVTNYLLWSFY